MVVVIKLTFCVLLLNVLGLSSSKKDIEDAHLSIMQLARKYGYPIEEHFVTTPDGYILRLHRIPHGRNSTKSNNKVVLCVHGFTSSSVDWILAGPDHALGYILADEGCDVWLANTRGNDQSRNHTTLNPNKDFKFWRFSFHEVGIYDMPTTIDYILRKTNQTELYHIGHSQGTNAFYVMATMRPEYNKKVKTHISLAPTPFLQHMRGLTGLVAPFEKLISAFSTKIQWGNFLPHHKIYTEISTLVCPDGSPFQFLCAIPQFALFGCSLREMITSMLSLFFGHSPAGNSVNALIHSLQNKNSACFCQYDYGESGNLEKYHTKKPPSYDLRKVTTLVYIFSSLNDYIVAAEDAKRLCDELGKTCIKNQLIEDRTFNHLDYLFGKYVVELVYNRIIRILDI